MNKKMISMLLIISFNLFFVMGQSYNIFTYKRISGIDYFTGNSLSQITNDDVLRNNNAVNKLTLEVKSNGSVGRTTYEYSEGRIVSISSRIRDGRNSIYKYNDNGFLEAVDFQERIYPKNNICMLYENGKLDSKITLNDNGNKKVITVERLKKNNELKLVNSYEYLYEDNLLVEYTESDFTVKGDIYSKRVHIFSYNNENLILHTVTVNDELRWVYELIYNDKNKLIKTIYKDIKYPNHIRYKFFEGYDEYDNWLYSKEFYGDDLTYEVTRYIDYKDK